MLHIHNGDHVAMLARRAGIAGRHVPFRETLITGPVRPRLPPHEWIEERARFITENYDQNPLRVRTELLEQERMLDDARREDEVVLWFEHDLFCLTSFLYLLSRLAKARHLSIIWSPQPLGTTEETELRRVFESRSAVLPSMMRSGANAWEAFTSSDATALNRFLLEPSADFPFLRDGFRLHASRFPSVRDGLGEVERRAMQEIAGGAVDFGTLFARFDENPPRFGFGDSEFLRHLRRLATCVVPMITIAEAEGETPPKALFTITPAGQTVLDGKVDYIELNNAGFWLGGAHLTRERLWRWDAQQQEIVLTSK